MTKISIDTKITAVEEYLTGTQSKTGVGKKYPIASMLFPTLVAIYNQHKRKGLLQPPEVTGKFRVALVQWKQQNYASVTETCAHCSFTSIEAVVRWKRLYNLYGIQALMEMRPGVKTHRKGIRSETYQAPRTREFIIADTHRRLKKTTSLERASNQELAQVITDIRAKYRLVDLIKALPISISVFQYWQARFRRPDKSADLKRMITAVFNEHHGNYGVPRIAVIVRKRYVAQELPSPNHKRIQRLMRELELNSSRCRQRT